MSNVRSVHRPAVLLPLVLFLAYLASGCTNRSVVPSPVNRPDMTIEPLVAELQQQYPDSFSLRQRIWLHVSGKQYDFLGQLVMVRGQAFRAVAFGEMGGLFLDILYRNEEILILANPAGLPEKALGEGVVRDILHLYNFRDIPQGFLFAVDDSLIGFSHSPNENDRVEFLFSASPLRLQQSQSFYKNKMIRQVTYHNYRFFEGWQKALPSKIMVNNHTWRYRLEIDLLQITPSIDYQRTFPADLSRSKP
jgi:hypothetical protein